MKNTSKWQITPMIIYQAFLDDEFGGCYLPDHEVKSLKTINSFMETPLQYMGYEYARATGNQEALEYAKRL